MIGIIEIERMDNRHGDYNCNNGGPSISGRGGSHENNYYDRYNMYGSSYGSMNDSLGMVMVVDMINKIVVYCSFL